MLFDNRNKDRKVVGHPIEVLVPQPVGGLSGKFEGSSSVLDAFDRAFESEAGAIILISDGLPNPAYNNGLASGPLVRAITVANRRQQEIHAVTVGDYFKYRGTVEFMESLARANGGDFLALSG